MRTVVLSDIIELIGGGTPKTSKPEFWNGDIPWLSVVDFGGDGRWVDKSEKTITNLGLENSSTKLLESGDIIISARGTVGELSQLKRPMAFNQSCYGIRARTGVNQDFLYYLLKKSVNDLRRQSHGGVFNTITRSTFDVVSVGIPNLETQKKIANILGSLDEKIELNRRMNETLEQLGQALFRHYFVDNPESKNWRRGVVSDLGEVVTGKTPSRKNQKLFGNEVAFLKVPDMHKTSIVIKTSDNLSLIGADSQKSKYIPKWSTCVSCIATVGVVSLAGKNMQTNQQINSIVPREACFKFFNYFLMQHKSDYIKTLASSGSATPNLNMGHFSNITVVMPDRELLKEFDTRVSHLFLQIENNLQENEILINIRNSLLPKLISGEIEI